jgi:hypothetical protein
LGAWCLVLSQVGIVGFCNLSILISCKLSVACEGSAVDS